MKRAALWALMFCSVAAAADAPTVKRYVGCPIYRDTDAGRKSGCWLASDPADGVVYDVTNARSKPLLGHQVLVEGVVATKDGELCGGTVLEPVSVSVLPELCKEFLIPAEGHPGRRFVLPERTMQPTWVERKLPAPPYGPREVSIEFELNSDFLDYQYSELILEDLSLYAKASKPKRITITGFAATRGMSVSGQHFSETTRVAASRAQMVALALERLGVPRSLMHVTWQAEAHEPRPAPEPLVEAAKRRVTVRIE